MKLILFGMTYQELRDNMPSIRALSATRSLFEQPEVLVISSLDSFLDSAERLMTIDKLTVLNFNPNQTSDLRTRSYYTIEEFYSKVEEKGLEIWTTSQSAALPEVVKSFGLVSNLNPSIIFVDDEMSVKLGNELFIEESLRSRQSGVVSFV